MSGSVGGTSFNLSLNVPDFKRQFTDARAVAAAGSVEVGRALNEITASAEKNAQQVSNALNRALGRGGVLTSWQEVRDAAAEAQKAVQAFAAGNTEAGLNRISNAGSDLSKILIKINDETAKINAAGVTSPAIEAQLKYFAAQATTLRNAQDSISSFVNQSSNKLGSATQQEVDNERRQTEIAIEAIRKQNIEYVKAAEQQLAETRKQDEIAANAIRKQTVDYVKAQEEQVANERKQNEIATEAIRKQNLAYVKASEEQQEAERRQTEIAVNAIRTQNINYQKAAERQLADQRKAAEKIIDDERIEREKRLADFRRQTVRQLKEEERANAAATGPSALSQFGSNILTGLGIGSGAQIAFTALNKVQQLLTQIKQGAIDFNDQLDQSKIAWTTFTGSAEKASAQVKILFDFAKVTPFTFEEVDSAARLLAAFGGAAFASTENLKLLGNVAAGTKQPLNNIAYEFGQIYTEIENGLPFGRAARALVQFGALTGETRVRLEEMQAAGADVNSMLDLLYKDLGRFGGQLEAQSKTLSGGLTTAKDSLQALEAIALRPGFEGLKNLLVELNKLLNNNSALTAAQNIQGFLYSVGDIFALAKDGFEGVLTGISSIIVLADLGITKLQYMADQARRSLPGNGGISDEKLAADKANLDQAATAYDRLIQTVDALTLKSEQDRIRFTTRSWGDAGKDAGTAFANNWQDSLKATLAGIQEDVTIRSQYAGLNASRAFVAGFSKENFAQLKDLSDVVGNAIFGSKASGKLKGDAEKLIADVRPLLVQAIDDIRQYGRVSESTFSGSGNLNDYTENISKLHDTLGALKAALPPDAFSAVKDYLDSIEQLADKETMLAFATAHLANEQNNLTLVQQRSTSATAAASAAVATATAVAARNSRVLEQELDSIKSVIDGLQEDARKSSQAWDDTLKGLRTDLEGLQATADANAKHFADMLEPLKKRQEELGTITKQNQDIYNAVLNGTTQEYLAQNEILSEQTRKIAEKWEAEIGGKRRALEGADSKVDTLEKRERAEVLALDEKIRAARAAHHNAEVVALEAQKKRLQDRYKYQIDIEQERAAVAKDQFDDASKGLTKEQKEQEAKDKAAETANQKQIDAVTAEAKIQKDLDDAAIAAKNAEIKLAQDQADADKRNFDDRIREQQAIQTGIEKKKKTQEEDDKNKLIAANDYLNVIKAQGLADEANAKDRVNAAKILADQAKTEATAQKDITDTIKDRIQFIQQENDAYLAKINAARANAGLPPLSWGQILAGNYPQDTPGGARGVGEGRQDPAAAASGAPSATPIPTTTNPNIQRLRYNPNLPQAAANSNSNFSDVTTTTMSNSKVIKIQSLHLFSNAQIHKDIDVDKAAIRAGNLLLQELNSEQVSGGNL